MVASNFAFKPQHSDEQIGLAPVDEFEANAAPETKAAIEAAPDADHERQRQRLVAEREQRDALQQQLSELRKSQKALTVRIPCCLKSLSTRMGSLFMGERGAAVQHAVQPVSLARWPAVGCVCRTRAVHLHFDRHKSLRILVISTCKSHCALAST